MSFIQIEDKRVWTVPEPTISSFIVKDIEYAGRHSSMTMDQTTPDFCKKRWAEGHFAVFEHSYISVAIRGISRILTHEFVRHRHLCFIQATTRRVRDFDIVCPPGEDPYVVYQNWKDIQEVNKKYTYKNKEHKRYFYPPCIEAPTFVSGNYRAWMEALPKRIVKRAAEEFRVLANILLSQIKPLVGIE